MMNIGRVETMNIFCGKGQCKFDKFEKSARNSIRHHVGWISSKTLKMDSNTFQTILNAARSV